MQALVTGASGFIGKNLCARLLELGYIVHKYVRDTSDIKLDEMISKADVIFHLAGANRPESDIGFERDNHVFTQTLSTKLAERLATSNRQIPLIFTSSIGALYDTPYGASKRAAENVLKDFAQDSNSKVRILRLPNIFGKECRPNYNSVVATFCSNAIAGEPLIVTDPGKVLRLLFIDDLIDQMLGAFEACITSKSNVETIELHGYYEKSVGDLAQNILKFDLDRRSGVVGKVGSGFDRKLYSTFISHLTPEIFVSPLEAKIDSRGSFAEFVKTTESGQVSVLKCAPGEVRGRHYHNTKSEQFLVIQGTMRVVFENVFSSERMVRLVSGAKYEVVWAIPGWSHSFENIGDADALALVWANEVFDVSSPDTYTYPKEPKNDKQR